MKPWVRRLLGPGILVGVFAIDAFLAGRVLTVLLRGDVAGYDAGALATFVGIVAGVPVALLIAGEQERRNEWRKAEDRREQAETVMNQIANDLHETREELKGRLRRERAIAPFLGSGLWALLKSSGELSVVENSLTIYPVSRAYDRVALTAYLERQLWELVHNIEMGAILNPPKGPAAWVLDTLRLQDEHTMAALDYALATLERFGPHMEWTLTTTPPPGHENDT